DGKGDQFGIAQPRSDPRPWPPWRQMRGLLQQIVGLHVQCGREGVYVSRHNLILGTLASCPQTIPWKTSCHCRGARGWMKLEAAPPADVVRPWRYVPVWKSDAGACPVGTPDCCCERVSQDLDLVRAPRAAPVFSIGSGWEVAMDIVH